MSRFESLQNLLSDKFGKNAFVPGNDRKFLDIRRVPTGLLELDIALAGGIPIGRATTIWGPKSSGKSTLCEKIIASFQRYSRESWLPLEQCPKFLEGEDPGELMPITSWVDVEGTFTSDHAERMGIDTSQLNVATPASGEETVTMVQALLETGKCDLIVVDSLAQMSPQAEVDRDLTETPRRIGEHAALVTQFLRKIGMIMNKVRRERGEAPTVLLINQERVKINTMGGRPGKMKPGGEAQGFAASVEVQLKSNRVQVEKDRQQNVTGVSYGEAFFRIEKSKVCTPHLSGRYRIWLADDNEHELGDTDDIDKVVKIAIQEGIVEKGPSKLIYKDENYKTQKYLRECMREDYNLYAELRSEIFARLLPKSSEARRALEQADETEETHNPFMNSEGPAHAKEEKDEAGNSA